MIQNYELKKQQLLMKQNLCCKTCGKKFTECQKIDLAHGIRASKYNYKTFSPLVIDHILNLSATHPGNCNDRCNINDSSTVAVQEKLIDILSSLVLDDSINLQYKEMNQSFENILTVGNERKLYTDNPVYLGQYKLLHDFFRMYKQL